MRGSELASDLHTFPLPSSLIFQVFWTPPTCVGHARQARSGASAELNDQGTDTEGPTRCLWLPPSPWTDDCSLLRTPKPAQRRGCTRGSAGELSLPPRSNRISLRRLLSAWGPRGSRYAQDSDVDQESTTTLRHRGGCSLRTAPGPLSPGVASRQGSDRTAVTASTGGRPGTNDAAMPRRRSAVTNSRMGAAPCPSRDPPGPGWRRNPGWSPP